MDSNDVFIQPHLYVSPNPSHVLPAEHTDLAMILLEDHQRAQTHIDRSIPCKFALRKASGEPRKRNQNNKSPEPRALKHADQNPEPENPEPEEQEPEEQELAKAEIRTRIGNYDRVLQQH